jgi:hypothetical protein
MEGGWATSEALQIPDENNLTIRDSCVYNLCSHAGIIDKRLKLYSQAASD